MSTSTQWIIVRPEPPGRFTAQVAGLPEVRVVASSERQALEQAQQLLTEWFATARMVSVNVAVGTSANGPARLPGQLDRDDPLEKEYLEELARLKREDLERTLAEYDQPCPGISSTPTT